MLIACLATISTASNNNLNNGEIKVINYQFDYYGMIIDGMEAKGFIALNTKDGYESPDSAFKKFTQKLEIGFISIVNGTIMKNNIRLDNTTESQYLVIISFRNIDKDGEHYVHGNLLDRKNGNKQIASFSVHAGGGRWGTFNHLFFGYALPKSGKRLGNKLKNVIKTLPFNK